MKALIMICPLSYAAERTGRIRYEKFISERLEKKDYTDVFQVVYKEDTKNYQIIAMRWVKIQTTKEECRQQFFEFEQSFFYTIESLTFSFEDILMDRLHLIDTCSVDIIVDDKNNYLNHLKEVLMKEKITPNVLVKPI